MSLSDNLKKIAPALSSLKTGTPGYKIGDKFAVGGIGGNFLPAGAGGAAFYKCASVTPMSEEGITLTGASSPSSINGFYELQSGEGTERVWKHSTESWYIVYEPNMSQWQILTSSSPGEMPYFCLMDSTEPYSSDWMEVEGSGSITTVHVPGSTINTWTGYKATQDSTTGIWSYESTLTTDELTFGIGFTPIVNGVYNADATVKINSVYTGLPTEGLVLYAPLTDASAAAETGQSITFNGTMTYATYKGIPCTQTATTGTSYIRIGNDDVPVNSDISMSFWIMSRSNTAFGMGSNGSGNRIWFVMNDSVIRDDGYGDGTRITTSIAPEEDTWYHVVYTSDPDGSTNIYINGVLAGTGSDSNFRSVGSGDIGFGIIPCSSSTSSGVNVRAAALRIYDRILTASEVALLYSEFSPE